MTQNFMQVAIRVRPLISLEMEQNETFCATINENQISLNQYLNTPYDDPSIMPQVFAFDHIYGPESSQREVFESCDDTVSQFLSGINGCILAYGQTSSGKSYTMCAFGDAVADSTGGGAEERTAEGIIPFSLSRIFNYVKNVENYELTLSYFEIYNEQVFDLLQDSAKLEIRENEGDVYVENLSKFVIESMSEALQLFNIGNVQRKTAETKMNQQSSRSHAVYELSLKQEKDGHILLSKLSILDLAGSERAQTLKKDRLRETKNINTSLAILSNVFNALLLKETNPKQYVPYRDSKLTRILQNSLGNNCRTSLIVNVSPAAFNYSESINSLKFADRAKQIRESAKINVVEGEEGKILRFKQEIMEVREQIELLKSRRLDAGNDVVGSAQELPLGSANQQLSQSQSQSESELNAELLSSLSRLEEQKCQILNQETQLNELRSISVDQKNIMIVLSQKMQDVEQYYNNICAEIEQLQCRIELISGQISIKKQFLGARGCLEGEKLSEQFIDKYELNSFIEKQENMISSEIEPNVLMAEIFLENSIPPTGEQELNFEQKQDEIQSLEQEYDDEIRELKTELMTLERDNQQLQVELEQQTDEFTADLYIEQQNDNLTVEKIKECRKERQLMLKIFKEKIQKKVNDLHDSDCEGLKEYILKVSDAVEFGQLYKNLNDMFSADK